MNRNLWKPEHQQALEQYYWAYTSTTSAETRAFLFNYILYQPLLNICQTALKSFKNPKFINDDYQQEAMIFCFKLLNRLDPNRFKDGLKASQNFIYLSTRRNIIDNIRKANQQPIDIVELDNQSIIDAEENYCLYDNSMAADKAFNDQQLKQDIIQALDKKIHKERIVNKSSTIFLILLKQYLIDNNYDERGFKNYVMQKMNINLSMYRAIASKVRISTLLLNKEY